MLTVSGGNGRGRVAAGMLNVAYRDATDPIYVCGAKGCVRIAQADLDTLAEAVMLDYLAQPDVVATLRAGDGDGDRELSEVRDRLAANKCPA